MVPPAVAQWISRCEAEGLKPAELRLVLERYRAYRKYYLERRQEEPLPIEAWFAWYRVETASEAGQQGPASGCSVDDDARNRGTIHKPEAFLRLLSQLAAIELVA